MPKLLPHPDFPPSRVTAIAAEPAWASGKLTFLVEEADNVLFPEVSSSVRTDGLWKATCFELFVKPDGADSYFEFNFSPSSAWAAYAFDDYRSGMRDLETVSPQIRQLRNGIAVVLDLSSLPQGTQRVGLSAIIEERDGTKSYWALAHPPGKPDFHHADCFALKLPAASGA